MPEIEIGRENVPPIYTPLFYDKNLSATNTVSCASCHIQANAFGDVAIASDGINGTTTRHAMRCD